MGMNGKILYLKVFTIPDIVSQGKNNVFYFRLFLVTLAPIMCIHLTQKTEIFSTDNFLTILS